MTHIRRYLIAGLLFWLPVWVTLLIVKFVFELLDGSLALLPANYQPEQILGVHIPGIGIILSLMVVFFTGMVVSNFLGKRLVALWEGIVQRIPLVRSIYSAVQKVLDTIFRSDGHAFRKVLLVEYPRNGLWSIAFLTSDGNAEVVGHIGEPMVTIFIPTTPNPTSGFLMMIPQKDVIELQMSVEEALKLVISLGVVQPGMDENDLIAEKST